MPSFRYTAKDKAGKTLNAILEAPDERALVKALHERDLIILSVTLQKVKSAHRIHLLNFGRKIKASDVAMFSRQLATMIEAGIPVVQSLVMLSEQTSNPAFGNILVDVKKDVSAGMAFSDSLARHPTAFNSLFVNMVRAGEASGALDEIMDRLATYVEKSESLNLKVRSAMNYPIVVSALSFSIVVLMLVKVVPVFKGMFLDFGGELPLPTRILCAISDSLIHMFYLWIGAVVLIGFTARRFLSNEKGALIFDAYKLKMPIFGTLVLKVAIGKFARTLSTLIRGGIPILQALDIVGKSSGNRVIEQALDKVKIAVQNGETISDPLLKAGIFPTLVVRMIAVGEETGSLEKMCTKIADFYEEQVDIAVSGLMNILEPLVIAFLGVVVGSIVMCMFLPMFKMVSIIH